MARHFEIDYAAFLPRLVAGLRKAWQEIRSRRRGETFYLFGIETDSDITDRDRAKKQREQPIRDVAITFLRRERRAFNDYLHAAQVPTVTPFLLKVLDEKQAPDALWGGCFDAPNEPDGRLHGPGVIIVYVIPKSGKCVIAP